MPTRSSVTRSADAVGDAVGSAVGDAVGDAVRRRRPVTRSGSVVRSCWSGDVVRDALDEVRYGPVTPSVMRS